MGNLDAKCIKSLWKMKQLKEKKIFVTSPFLPQQHSSVFSSLFASSEIISVV